MFVECTACRYYKQIFTHYFLDILYTIHYFLSHHVMSCHIMLPHQTTKKPFTGVMLVSKPRKIQERKNGGFLVDVVVPNAIQC